MENVRYEDLTPSQQAITAKAFMAVREDKIVGSGTCSSIDECFTDAELMQEIFQILANDVARGVNGVVKHFRKVESAHRDFGAEIQAEAF